MYGYRTSEFSSNERCRPREESTCIGAGKGVTLIYMEYVTIIVIFFCILSCRKHATQVPSCVPPEVAYCTGRRVSELQKKFASGQRLYFPPPGFFSPHTSPGLFSTARTHRTGITTFEGSYDRGEDCMIPRGPFFRSI